MPLLIDAPSFPLMIFLLLLVVFFTLLVALIGLFFAYRQSKPTHKKRRTASQNQPPTIWRTHIEEEQIGQAKNIRMMTSLDENLFKESGQLEERETDVDLVRASLSSGGSGEGSEKKQPGSSVEAVRPFPSTPPVEVDVLEPRKPLALLKVVRGQLERNQYEIYADGFIIGRGRDADLQIRDERVSRKHAVIRYYQGMWFIQDQQSLNGISVNGTKVKATQINSSDEIEIADYLFRFVKVQ